jgi:hypothetical protein
MARQRCPRCWELKGNFKLHCFAVRQTSHQTRFKKVNEMKYSAKVMGIVIILTAGTATVPRLLAQATQAGAPQSASSVATQLGVSVYPKNNQDQGQQAKDENECYNIAKQQSGIDPAAQQAQEAKGAGAKGAAKGAAVGAIAGDAGTGAAVGAVHGRRKEKRASQQAEQQTQQPQQQQSMDTFKKSFSSCMDARKYSVK